MAVSCQGPGQRPETGLGFPGFCPSSCFPHEHHSRGSDPHTGTQGPIPSSLLTPSLHFLTVELNDY